MTIFIKRFHALVLLAFCIPSCGRNPEFTASERLQIDAAQCARAVDVYLRLDPKRAEVLLGRLQANPSLRVTEVLGGTSLLIDPKTGKGFYNDPWGSEFRVKRNTAVKELEWWQLKLQVYSTGQNLKDEAGSGDDVVPDTGAVNGTVSH